jgi:hypothetical protein
MSIVEAIEFSIINADVVERESTAITIAQGVDAGIPAFIPDVAMPSITDLAIVFEGDETEAYVIIGQDTLPDGTVYYILNRPLENDTVAGQKVYLANVVSKASHNLVLQINADRIDKGPTACYLRVSNPDTEYPPMLCYGDVLDSPVEAWTDHATITTQEILNGSRVLAYTGGELRRHTPIQVEYYDEKPFEVVDAFTATIMLAGDIEPLIIGYCSGTTWEFKFDAGMQTEIYGTVNSSDTTAVSGIAHNHLVYSHAHFLIRNATIPILSATSACSLVSPNDKISINGHVYNVASITSNCTGITLGGALQSDVFEGNPIYLLKFYSATAKVNLWRHRAIVTLPPAQNIGLGVHQMSLALSLTEGGTALASGTYYFYRYAPIQKVMDLGGNKYRFYIDNLQPAKNMEIYNATEEPTDWFGVQVADTDEFTKNKLKFAAPDRPGNRSDW